mgnify:CR=1 FL=1
MEFQEPPSRSLQLSVPLRDRMKKQESLRREFETFVRNSPTPHAWVKVGTFRSEARVQAFRDDLRRMRDLLGYNPWDSERYETRITKRVFYVRLLPDADTDDPAALMNQAYGEALKRFLWIKP